MQHRERLLTRIRLAGKICVVCAPPGFGKGALLRSLWDEWSRSGPAEFCDAYTSRSGFAVAAGTIAERTGSAAVIIEDADEWDKDLLLSIIKRSARDDTSYPVCLSLTDPARLNLHELRAAGLVEWIDATQLRLTDREAAAALKPVAQKRDRDLLHMLAGCWPIAVELLQDWALRANPDQLLGGEVDLIHASGLFDFVKGRIISNLSSAELTALTKASLLEVASRRVIATEPIDERNLLRLNTRFAGLIDVEGDRFVINRALKLCLSENSLLRDGAAHRGQMVQLADLCSENGLLRDAARIAAEAGASERIGAYAEKHGALLIWLLCGFADVRALVENAGDDVIARSPVLRMMRCIVDLKSGRIRQAETELNTLCDDRDIARDMRREIEIVRVTLLVYGCSLARRHDLELLAELLAEQSSEPAWQTFLATLSCILNSQRARFEIAAANLREARIEAGRAGSEYNLMFLFVHEAVLLIPQGKVAEARGQLAKARKMWREKFASDVALETVIASLAAKIEFETGKVTSARNSLRHSAYRMPDGEAWFDIYFAAYEPMARLYCDDHGPDEALAWLKREQAKLDSQGLSRVGRLLGGIAVCLAGEARLSGRYIALVDAELPAPHSPDLSWQEREVFTLARAHSLHCEGRSEAALKVLNDVIGDASAGHNVHTELRALLLAFQLYHLRGERADATMALCRLVEIGARTGMRKLIQDHVGTLVAYYSADLVGAEFFDEAQTNFLHGLTRVVQRSASASESLSEREKDVLLGLSYGGSDKQIARDLGISDHGVRYHLKSIFRKLGVHDRLAAILAAQTREWI